MPNATTYTTRQGDTWDIISYRLYGDEQHIALLAYVNPLHAKISLFPANITLKVPILPAEKRSVGLPPWITARG